MLVAFTIEFDNEFEHQMPHRTTTQGSKDGPWLVSLVMWSNCMQFVREEGVSVSELEALARTPTNLNGMERWGYIVVAPSPADKRPRPPRPAWLIRPTAKGRQAQDVWRPLFGVIEKRWHTRYGKDQIDQLKESLRAVINRIELDLPDCLPILGYGLYSKAADHKRQEDVGSDLPLSALLSKVLLAFAIEFERESDLSLAISANVLRLLDETGERVRDLPLLSGVSKESISMALGVLQKKRVATVEPDQTASRTKVARLTSLGVRVKDAYLQLLGKIEESWQARFGKEVIVKLRKSLEQLVGDPTAPSPPFRGLEPYPDGWRASVRKPTTLPHYPMILHRGGYPDGS